MSPAITRHAATRMQQRAIPHAALDLLLDFGSTMRCRGAERFYFDRTARRHAAEILDSANLRRPVMYLNAYAVVSDDGAVITAAWRTARLRRA